MTSDDDLVRRINQRDPEAIEEALRRHDRAMRLAAMNILCIKMTPSVAQEEVNDVIQDVALALLATDGREIKESLSAYLRKMTYNMACTRIRKIRSNLPLDAIQDTHVEGVPNPEDLLYSKEVSALVRREISQLSPDLREPLTLSMEKVPQDKIAEKLEVQLGTVKSRLYRARKKLSERPSFRNRTK